MKTGTCFALAIIFLLSFLLPAFSYRIHTEIRINVPSRTLKLYKAGRLLREYPVGVGNSKRLQTPPGNYKVETKVLNPIWEHPYKPDGQVRVGNNPKNPLGSRWIGFHKEGSGVYGVHGTNQPNSVGRFVSHGCVRMHNTDVEEIFELVDIGTPVRVTYKRFYTERVGNKITLEVFPDPYHYQNITVQEVVAEIRRIHPFAEIDFELLQKAINDKSDSAIYEVASISYQNFYRPYTHNYYRNHSSPQLRQYPQRQQIKYQTNQNYSSYNFL